MAWDLATAHAKTGLAPGLSDDVLTAAMSTALAIAERYCDRLFLQKQEQVRFYDISQRAIQLPRYPVESVDDTYPSLNDYAHHLHRGGGKIMFHGQPFFEELRITYTGGFKNLPEDLEFALWQIFGLLWSTSFDPTAGTGGGATIALGAVKRKTIVGVGSIEYETGGASSSGGDSVAADWSSALPGATQAILDLYRRQSV